MIIGDGLDYLEAYGAVREAEAVLNRPVNPTIYSLLEFRKRQRSAMHFWGECWTGPRCG